MNCQSARELFPVLLDPRTPANAQAEARAHLAACADCQREYAALAQTLATLDTLPAPTPSPRLREGFYAMLAEEKRAAAAVLPEKSAERVRAQPAQRSVVLRWILAPLAVAGIAVAAFQAGARHGVATTAGEVAREDATTARKLDQLEKRLDEMRSMMAFSIVQQQQNVPTSTRFQEVLTAAKDTNPSEKTLNELLNALVLDPSANVRLRAVEALLPHVENTAVRSGILSSLTREQNPLVQVELIEAVAVTHDPDAAPVLRQLARDEAVELAVREAARNALAQL